jgi:hypothetical protein
MLRTKLVHQTNDGQEQLGELSLPHLPKIGDTVGKNYRVVGISYPVAIGKNLAAGEPEMGARLYVECLKQKDLM